jgi:alanine racemase
MPKITISDIARRASVSKTAVSFAFNDPSRLSAETVQRILEAADELGYVPNPVARSLTSKRTGNIGLLFPQPLSYMLANPYTAELQRGVGLACDRSGFNMLLVSPLMGSLSRAVGDAVVDGFLTIGLEHDKPTIELLERRGVPYVMVDSEPYGDVACVNTDDEAGAYLAMRHVLEHGHRRITILGIESGKHGQIETYVGTLQRRVSGYRKALAEYGLDIDGQQVQLLECSCTFSGGRDGFAQCWGDFHPTAIVAMADVQAVGALEAARVAHVRVPEQLSVVGFDNVPIATFSWPPLTTVHQPIHEKGDYAASVLLDIIAGGAPPTQRIFPTRLVERSSVATIRP